MNTDKLTNKQVSSMLFELGLAINLNKISLKEINKVLPIKKINRLTEKIEKTYRPIMCDDSHIKSYERLSAALEFNEVSQAELAKMMKVAPQKVNDLVKGRLKISINWAKKIGQALGVDYRVFL